MDPVQFTPDQLRKDEEKLQNRVRRRSLVGGGAAWLVVATFALYFFVFPDPLQRIGSVLSVVGGAYLIIQLRMRSASVMPESGETESIRFYRAELERQRDFHCGAWLWSRAVMILPGPMAFMAGFVRAHLEVRILMGLTALAFLLVLAVGVRLNLTCARQHQRRIDALDAWLKM